jgi:hypothetical protein
MQSNLANNEIYEKALFEYAKDFHQRKSSSQEIENGKKSPRYVIYARRSTKGEDQRTMSPESQIKECRSFAKREKLDIVGEPLVEKETAKIAGKYQD